MKNFSELLDTKTDLEVVIRTSATTERLCWHLLEPLDIACQSPESVCVDGMEILHFGWYQDGIWRIRHDEPFYRWRHRVTGQGWLLEPARTAVRESNGNV